MRQVLKMRLSAKVTVPQVRRPHRAEIRKQLERMLAHPLFKNSHRYPKLLQHVVRRAIEGCQAELKERTIGIQLFGRIPGYDTNADPIVRATAGEIRKRIALYFQDDGQDDLVHIGLSPGSYVPEFRFRRSKSARPKCALPGLTGAPR